MGTFSIPLYAHYKIKEIYIISKILIILSEAIYNYSFIIVYSIFYEEINY